MKILKKIPEQNTEIEVLKVSIDIENKSARVIYKLNAIRKESFVSLTSILNNESAQNSGIINVFLKKILAAGLDVKTNDVPDIF